MGNPSSGAVLDAFDEKQRKHVKSFEGLTKQVEGTVGAATSARAVLVGIVSEIRAMADGPGAKEALAQRIEAVSEVWAVAIEANGVSVPASPSGRRGFGGSGPTS